MQISSITPYLPVLLCASKMWTTLNKEEQRLVMTQNYGKIHAGNIVASVQLKSSNSGAAQSEGCDCGLLKAKVPLDRTLCKIQRQQVGLCSCWVVSKRLEMTTQKTSMMIGRWNCLVILANMEMKGEIKMQWKHIVVSDVKNIRQTIHFLFKKNCVVYGGDTGKKWTNQIVCGILHSRILAEWFLRIG